jgi:recombination protein RecT
MSENTQAVAAPRVTFGKLLQENVNRRALSTLLETDDKGLTRYIAQAYMLVMGNPKLSECTPMSLMKAVKDAASVRLSLDPVLARVYIVPYRKKSDRGWISEAQMQLGYRGVMELAYRSGDILTHDVRPVWSWDTLKLQFGTRPDIEHVPNEPTGPMEHDNMKGAYLVVFLRDGSKKVVWMWRDEIDACRARSKSWQTHVDKGYESPWATSYAEMALTKVVHRGGKQLNLSPRDMRALIASEARDEGREEPREVDAEVVQNDADLNALLDQPLPEPQRDDEKPVDLSKAETRTPQDPPGGVTGSLKKDGGGPRQ